MNGSDHAGGRESGRSDRNAYRDERRDRDRDRERTRRRSRSPANRGGSRRERDYEVDTYSSSRDHREREREERYSTRDRNEPRGDRDRGDRNDRGDRGDRDRARGDRSGGDRGGWDRERGPRRDRPDDDRRRNRDPYEDRRRGGGGGGGGGYGRGEAQQRPRSASPPPKKKEPTPDLTDVVSVLERKRRLTQWDIKPPGYENVTAEQAKLSGMFPLPGAPRQQVMDPTRLQAFMEQPGGNVSNTALAPSNSRQAKRLFVYNLPSTATSESISEFFNLQLNGTNVVQGTDPCISAVIAKGRESAMLEFRNSEEATVALALDGIEMEASDTMETSNGVANGGQKGLKIKRPSDYISPSALDESEYTNGVMSNVVKDSPNKLAITNVPAYLNEEQLLELISTFGGLKSFVLVKDATTEQSRGIAFCEYADASVTEIAMMGLNGMSLGDSALKIQRASVGHQQVAAIEMGVNAMSMLAGTQSADLQESRVIQLLNMVTADELMDNDEYAEILEDITEECSKFGEVLSVKIPRPSLRDMSGVGKVFIKFNSVDNARAAISALAGRKFQDRTVIACYSAEELFDVDAW